MKNITELGIKKEGYPIKVIQFGEGNFLRAFIDWQIQQMNKKGLFKGTVAIVQPIEQGLTELLDEQEDLYTVVLEGLLDGKKVQSDEIIRNIAKTVRPYDSFDEYLALADIPTAEFIFSNTTEAGITFDASNKFEDRPANSYPGKLTQLLYRRFKNGLAGFQIIPCELIEHNGDHLKKAVLQYADLWDLGMDFKAWIETENDFYSTLVDRIVPGFPHDTKEEVFERIAYEDNMLVKAEAFLLFVIEGKKKFKELWPASQVGINVIVTDDMQPYRERKVRILNGPHTTMTALGLLAGLETVEDVMKDEDFSQFILDEMKDEISPMIALPEEDLAMYRAAIKERFENPFVHHELKSISLNSISKCEYRLLPTILQTIERTGKIPGRITLGFSAWLMIYGPYESSVEANDTPEVMAALEELKKAPDYLSAVLGQESFWGTDLTQYPELVAQVKKNVAELQSLGARTLLQKFNKGN